MGLLPLASGKRGYRRVLGTGTNTDTIEQDFAAHGKKLTVSNTGLDPNSAAIHSAVQAAHERRVSIGLAFSGGRMRPPAGRNMFRPGSRRMRRDGSGSV